MTASSHHRFPFTSPNDASQSWLKRISDNFHQLFEPTRLTPTAANGAPIHLVKPGRTLLGRSQSVSLVAHAALITGLLLLASQARQVRSTGESTGNPLHDRVFLPPGLLGHALLGQPSSGQGSGGHHDAEPATRGDLAPRAPYQFFPPHLPANSSPRLAVASTVFDANAPLEPVPIVELGLPWMKEYNNSQGPGGPEGFGSRPGRTMGDSGINGTGGRSRTPGPYREGVTMPACIYCPNPNYTDEARERKLQGIVAMQVLVTAEGRAGDVRVYKGLGLGLDERAEQVVRTWRFQASRDALGRAVPAWVTVEVTFHLY